jgi:small-conductance mechanosensitive channel
MGKENIEQKVERLKENAEVRHALEQTGGNKPLAKPKVEAKHKLGIGIYVLLLLGFAVFYYILRLEFLKFGERFDTPVQRGTLAAMTIVLILILSKIIKVFLISRVRNRSSQYNLRRVVNLLAGLAIFFIVLSILFANWYTAVVSLGLISLILGFALQTPITSFIGWIYLLVKEPYKVGDRIRIGEATGDVIDVSYLDTTLWEFGGQYLSTDHPSGRIIKFPNSNVLSSSVYNYSWAVFPYIWNEVKFQIAYDSDLEFVARVMREAAEEEVGEAMMERILIYRELLSQTPVDELEVRERPNVVFRVGENTWIEAIVRYLVEPRAAGRIKSALIKKMLDRLNAEPGKVKFPKGDAR